MLLLTLLLLFIFVLGADRIGVEVELEWAELVLDEGLLRERADLLNLVKSLKHSLGGVLDTVEAHLRRCRLQGSLHASVDLRVYLRWHVVLEVAVCVLSVLDQAWHLVTRLLSGGYTTLKDPDFLLQLSEVIILVFYHGLELAPINAHLFDLLDGGVEAFRDFLLEIGDLFVVDTPTFVQEVFKVFDLPSDLVLR